MTRFWKIILWIFGILLVAGIVIGGAGLLTDASPDRMAELLYGGWDNVRASLDALWTRITAPFLSLWSLF